MNDKEKVTKDKILRQPRIELGAQQWECWILPLNHWRDGYFHAKYKYTNTQHFFSFILILSPQQTQSNTQTFYAHLASPRTEYTCVSV